MSLHSYERSLEMIQKNEPFASYIFCAMRKANSFNIELLKDAFPGLWIEFKKRYNAPGGLLDDD